MDTSISTGTITTSTNNLSGIINNSGTVPGSYITGNQWIQPQPITLQPTHYTIPMPTPHGCNSLPDGNKLVILIVRRFEDIRLLGIQVMDIVYCLDTKKYWKCIDAGMSTSNNHGILAQIISISDAPVFKEVIITEDLNIVEVIEPVKLEELNPDSKELYEAFEKVLDIKNIKVESKKPKAKHSGIGKVIEDFFNPPDPHLGVPC